MSVRAIQAHLREAYRVEVGHDLMSWITEAILGDAGTSHSVRVGGDQSRDPSKRAHPRGVRPSRRSGSPMRYTPGSTPAHGARQALVCRGEAPRKATLVAAGRRRPELSQGREHSQLRSWALSRVRTGLCMSFNSSTNPWQNVRKRAASRL
jgi:hypothetical protein